MAFDEEACRCPPQVARARICAQWLFLRRRPMLGEAHLPLPARVLLNPISSGLGHQRWISTRLLNLKSDGAHTWISARLPSQKPWMGRRPGCRVALPRPRPWAPEVHIGTPPRKPWWQKSSLRLNVGWALWARFMGVGCGHVVTATPFLNPGPMCPFGLWVTMPGRRMSSWGGFGVAFARAWVPPWRARGSWQTQSRKINQRHG